MSASADKPGLLGRWFGKRADEKPQVQKNEAAEDRGAPFSERVIASQGEVAAPGTAA